ncbi:MAG: type secretion system protein [Betaproteobacteria bacterium]|nr:type secretion system protein [Betaproteobacteria bacterium]
MSKELPEILSDEEIERRVKEREQLLRSGHDRWDNSGVISKRHLSDGLPESTIEQLFPRIAEKLAIVWPSEACAMYITSLLVNTRETRQGFPPEVVEDLLMLHSINDILLRSNPFSPRNPPRKTRSSL